MATTALALIPLASATGGYLGQGNVSRDAAIRGLVLLVEAQLEDGTFGASDPGMNALQQAWAATALCLYRRPTKWEELKFASAAQKAVAALLRMQTRTGSWPGPPGLEDADVVTTGWAALALCAAAQASVEFDHVNLSAAADDLDRCAALLAIPGPQSRPTLGTARALRAAAMAVVARAFVAPEATLASPTEPLLLAIDPKSIPLGELDPATAFFAIRAHQLVAPRRSSAAAGAAFWLRVRDSTCSVGCRSCSWNPSGAWGRAGGRLYSAATGLMCELAYFGSPSLPGRR